MGPIVYLVERAGQALYVGVSAKGVGRPLSGNHHALYDLHAADIFYIWKFAEYRDAVVFERLLIERLSPERNRTGDPLRCRTPWDDEVRAGINQLPWKA